MKLEFYNCPSPEDISSRWNLLHAPLRGSDDTQGKRANFLSYQPDFKLIEDFVKTYGGYRNLLIIGHGGSITSFYGLYHALKNRAAGASGELEANRPFGTGKEAWFLSTVDPDYIAELKARLKPDDTLVIAISKSGETITQIEMLAQFLNYPLLIITGRASPLRAIGEKLKIKIVTHPEIGGRYTGLTEVALLPAALCGIDVRALYVGAEEFYRHRDKDNLAWRAASVFYQLEQRGFVDVFMPFYSEKLFAVSKLIVQLCHESFGKEGKGQTYFAHEAPESQHHTNQRFFGGRKNICGFFVTVNHFGHALRAVYPPLLHSVQIKGRHLADIGGIPLEAAMLFEAQATIENARIQGIPLAHLSISGFTERSIGEFIAFWQMYAVYASVLRGVDPFDQPQVENSKKISFDKRLQYKGLL